MSAVKRIGLEGKKGFLRMRKKENAPTKKLRPGKSVFHDRGEEKREEIKNEINEGDIVTQSGFVFYLFLVARTCFQFPSIWCENLFGLFCFFRVKVGRLPRACGEAYFSLLGRVVLGDPRHYHTGGGQFPIKKPF